MFVMMSVVAKSQECRGTFGRISGGTTFDSGTDPNGAELKPENTGAYKYVTGQPEDGKYTIVKTTAGMDHVKDKAWHLATNHTENDPNGYMMVVNADHNPGIFYKATIDDLCSSTTYKFAAWVMNLLTPSTPGRNPQLTFIIEDTNGNPLMSPYLAPEIEQSATPLWEERFTIFRTPPGITSVVIKIINNAPGGAGNDLALDDISFKACGPVIIPVINNEVTQNKKLCVGLDKTFNFSAQITDNVYTNTVYLWQKNEQGKGWEDMPDEKTNTLTKTFINAEIGTYEYRLFVSEAGNINSKNCRSESEIFKIEVVEPPIITASNEGPVCIGQPIHLTADEGIKYEWTGPNGFSSAERSPVIPEAPMTGDIVYHVTVTTESDCKVSAQTIVTVVPIAEAEIKPVLAICKGGSVTLSAKEGGIAYRWVPETGLSDPKIREPRATLSETTTYTVYVFNGVCETPAGVTVFVLKDPLAQAGPDLKIMKGNSAQLNGKAYGDSVRYVWTPANYLDDQFKLNPVATPPSDITYTLNVISKEGCVTGTDDMFIRVYDKLIVPNAFSPNADGTNDVWNITAIDLYPNVKVTVVNRYGQPVFESTGYQKAWDGRCQNQEVPTGVYYYIINLSPGLKTLTGSVMVLR